MEFITSPHWKTTYPGASVGILLLRDVANPPNHPALDARKAEVEAALRSRFAGADRSALKALPTIRAYGDYYRRFDKTYHVLLQLESVVFKNKSIPSVAALVEAMFIAELQNQLLTAGHDADVLRSPLGIDVASGSETYVLLSGRPQTLAAGDMFIHDAQGVLSSILHGPDQRTAITPNTRQALFTVYAPVGIAPAAVESHLRDIQSNVLLVSPNASVERLEVLSAD